MKIFPSERKFSFFKLLIKIFPNQLKFPPNFVHVFGIFCTPGECQTKANCAKAVTHSNTNPPCMFCGSNPAEPFHTVFYKPVLIYHVIIWGKFFPIKCMFQGNFEFQTFSSPPLEWSLLWNMYAKKINKMAVCVHQGYFQLTTFITTTQIKSKW